MYQCIQFSKNKMKKEGQEMWTRVVREVFSLRMAIGKVVRVRYSQETQGSIQIEEIRWARAGGTEVPPVA